MVGIQGGMIELQKENEEAISHENVRSLLFLHKKLLYRQSAQRKGEEIMDQENKERQLQDASGCQNTAVLRETVLENEKSKLQEMLEQMEKRLQERAGEKDRLAGKVAELTIVNQKLADEKAKLLKLQLEQGGK